MARGTTKKQTKKNTVAAAEKENKNAPAASGALRKAQELLQTILSSAQLSETCHKRYIKELKQLYTKLDHNTFVSAFINILKTVLEAEESNEYGNMSLAFCAKFVTSFESENTHSLLAETFRWLLSTISNSPHIRYRICFFVNRILKDMGPYAALDDTQCDQILNYMLSRLTDIAPGVRKQAVLAMQRLQMPDKPDDPVLCAYQFHLGADPSPSVRQCIITCMGRNYLTVPYILQRLWDVDEKVRRHTYVNMCSYPVRSYKVSQRLTLVEQGLNDRSENVRKTFIKYMLKAWIEAYQRDFILLVAALKLDSNEEELLRFKRVASQMLHAIFEQNDNAELLALLPLSEDCELHRCVPQEALTVELVIYWQCLSSYLQKTQADECELVLPELSVFCAYVEKFCQFQKPDMDKFAQIEFQSMLLSLVEILNAYDLGDEIGRSNLKNLITELLKNCLLDHKIVALLVRCMEQLITDMNARMQYFIDIIYEICELNATQNDLVHDRSLINKLLDDLDTSLKMKVSSLKLKVLELEEQEDNFVRQKEYIRAQSVNDEKMLVTEEYTELIRPLLEKHGVQELPARPKLSKQERVLKALYISFYMVASELVECINPSICKLYKDFICRHMASSEADIFEWYLKCATTFSMFYEAYTKEVFEILMGQFYKDNNLRLWQTSAECVFELMDHYGVYYFIDANQTGQPLKSTRRQLYTMHDYFDVDDDKSQSQSNEQNTDIIGMMGHFVEKVVDKGIGVAIVRGLCRLILRGQLNDRTDVLEKLLKRYFNPNTEPIISQMLGTFFEKLVELKMQGLLEPCLLPTVWTIMNCNYDSPLHDVVPDNITKFFIDFTVQEASTPQNNIHNKIALSFLHYIHNYFTERKELCRLLSKDLTTLQLNVVNSVQIKEEMLEIADKLIKSELEPRVIRNIINFKGLLAGNINPPKPKEDGDESDEECDNVTVSPGSENVEANAPKSVNKTVDTSVGNANETEAVTTQCVTSETATVPAEPVLTTYGEHNEVGHCFLRRSLHNSICYSDAESIIESQTSTHEVISPRQDQAEKVKEISNRNLHRPKIKQRLEKAFARASKTPEKEPTSPVMVRASENANKDVTNVNTDDLDTSEVIGASPTSASPNISANMSRLRMRSLRCKSTANQSVTTSKRKVLHLETHTPLRNGRKRLLRKSPANNSNKLCSPKESSPKRKQQRLEGSAKPQKQPTNKLVKNTKSTESPTDSTSSIKENEVPKQVTKPAKSTSTKQQISTLPKSAHAPTVTTRNSARKLRITSMCMTRKRLSLEMNLSDGQLKLPTPKRPQRERPVVRTSAANASSSGNKSRTHNVSSESKTVENRPTSSRARTRSMFDTPRSTKTRSSSRRRPK